MDTNPKSAMQRIQPFPTGSFLEAQFLRLAYPSAVNHGGQKRGRSGRLTNSTKAVISVAVVGRLCAWASLNPD